MFSRAVGRDVNGVARDLGGAEEFQRAVTGSHTEGGDGFHGTHGGEESSVRAQRQRTGRARELGVVEMQQVPGVALETVATDGVVAARGDVNDERRGCDFRR